MLTNKDKLIRTVAAGIVRPPVSNGNWKTTFDGRPHMLAGCGGIVYNVHVGDSAFGWAADHLEPGASTANVDSDACMAYYNNCCIGNTVEVTGGPAEGARGYAMGKHAGPWHVVAEFAESDLRKMRLKDTVQVEVYGVGLELTDYPDVHLNSIDPECLEAMGIEEKDGKLHIPVAGVVPAVLMGSGLGSKSPMGDVDFMASDWDAVKEYGLDEIRLGDIVMVQDYDTSYGAYYKRGAASLGVIVHADSPNSGHGPGITFFMGCAKPRLVPVIDKTANIGKYHKIAYGEFEPLSSEAKK